MSTDFWTGINASLDTIESQPADTVDKVLAALGPVEPGVAAGDGFFGGSGGDRSLWSALRAAGWSRVWVKAKYYYVAHHPQTRELLTYCEGDVYRGDRSGRPSPLPTGERTRERAQFLADVLTTALEGGIGYWSSASAYRWWSPDLRGGTAEHREGEPNAYAVISETEQPPVKPGEHFVGVEQIEAAIARIIESCHVEPTGAGSLGLDIKWRRQIRNASEESDAGEIDADLADHIVQVAVLGQVIYG